MTVLFACVSLAAASQNIAQHHQQRGPQLFGAVRVEFEQLRSLRWVGGNDTFLRTHISNELRDLQIKQNANGYDQQELYDVIDSLVRLSKNQMVSKPDAKVLQNEAMQLKQYRQDHERQRK